MAASENIITITEFCRNYRIDEPFVLYICELEIIQVKKIGGEAYIPEEELPVLERMVRLHQDLGINHAGLETIHFLLERMTSMQEEMRILKTRLELYE